MEKGKVLQSVEGGKVSVSVEELQVLKSVMSVEEPVAVQLALGDEVKFSPEAGLVL